MREERTTRVFILWNSDSSRNRSSKLGEAQVLPNWEAAGSSPEITKSEIKVS